MDYFHASNDSMIHHFHGFNQVSSGMFQSLMIGFMMCWDICKSMPFTGLIIACYETESILIGLMESMVFDMLITMIPE